MRTLERRVFILVITDLARLRFELVEQVSVLVADHAIVLEIVGVVLEALHELW